MMDYYDVSRGVGVIACDLCGYAEPLNSTTGINHMHIHWERFHKNEVASFEEYRNEYLGDSMFESEEGARKRARDLKECGMLGDESEKE
jgi:hypothetical protein